MRGQTVQGGRQHIRTSETYPAEDINFCPHFIHNMIFA